MSCCQNFSLRLELTSKEALVIWPFSQSPTLSGNQNSLWRFEMWIFSIPSNWYIKEINSISSTLDFIPFFQEPPRLCVSSVETWIFLPPAGNPSGCSFYYIRLPIVKLLVSVSLLNSLVIFNLVRTLICSLAPTLKDMGEGQSWGWDKREEDSFDLLSSLHSYVSKLLVQWVRLHPKANKKQAR